jgi:hypothetical protein
MIALSAAALLALTSPALAAPPTPAVAIVVPASGADAAEGAGDEATPQPASAVVASFVIKVDQREVVADALVEQAEGMGGYFSSRTLDAVELRVPVASADAMIAQVEAAGLCAGRSYERTDLSAPIAEQEARLAARQQVLEQYFALLPEAGPEAVLTVEREITRLVAEVEGLQGSLRMMRHRADYAAVSVSFQFRDRAAPVRDGSSSFDWLNSLNLADLMDDFRYGYRGEGPRSGAPSQAPAGFSAYRKGRERRAVSPDEVVFRIRAARHKPKAELSFWQEATRVRMVEAGYRLVREETFDAGGTRGALLELTAPLGSSDYTYLIAVFPRGRKLILVEAAGEIEDFEARRAEIEAAVQGLAF